jgi:hypothetical protein
MITVFNRDNIRKSRIAQFRRLNAGTTLQALAVAIVLLFATTNAHADYLNLQTAGSFGSINGAIFQQGAQLSGTGRFPAFVQITGSGNPDESIVNDAYNTEANGVLDNGSSNEFNFTLTVAQMVTVQKDGVNYFQFFLDINENSSAAGEQFLSLDELRVFSGPVALNQNTTDVDGVAPFPLGTLRYDMDAGANDGILLNYDLEPGSGRADMIFLVPVWAGANLTDAVYLYSKFGALVGTPTCGGGDVIGGAPGCAVSPSIYSASDGFEEWALGTGGQVIPEPSTYALYALGAAMLFVSGWWQKRRMAYDNRF